MSSGRGVCWNETFIHSMDGHDPQGIAAELDGTMMIETIELRGGVDVAGQPQLGHATPAAAATEVTHQRGTLLGPIAGTEPDRLVDLRPESGDDLGLIVHEGAPHILEVPREGPGQERI